MSYSATFNTQGLVKNRKQWYVSSIKKLCAFLSIPPSSLILDQCCYFYASAPYNDSNCIPESDQLPLNCIIHNPRDAFTNLSVRWYRSRDMSAVAEDIADIQSTEYMFNSYSPRMSSLQTNCTLGRLYADTFSLIIDNFTPDKNGYYWCQILINDSFTQPSQRTWFYAAGNNSCVRQDPYFRSVRDQAQCALVSTGKPPSTIF